MSDHSISLVPKLSACKEGKQKASEILKWLISLDIVKPEPSDCTLGPADGYALSRGASKITAEPEYLPFELLTNGLEIITERHVFHTGENGIEALICPNCQEDIASEDWNFLNEWSSIREDIDSIAKNNLNSVFICTSSSYTNHSGVLF